MNRTVEWNGAQLTAHACFACGAEFTDVEPLTVIYKTAADPRIVQDTDACRSIMSKKKGK